MAGDTSATPGQHVWMELPVAPGGHVPLQQALVVGPARVVGVGHLPDDMAGVPLQVVEREVRDQGRRALPARTAVGRRVVPRRVLVLAG